MEETGVVRKEGLWKVWFVLRRPVLRGVGHVSWDLELVDIVAGHTAGIEEVRRRQGRYLRC